MERSELILNEFFRALNRHFPVGCGIEVDFTDRFANCYDFDPTDEGWLKDVDCETSSRESSGASEVSYTFKILILNNHFS